MAKHAATRTNLLKRCARLINQFKTDAVVLMTDQAGNYPEQPLCHGISVRSNDRTIELLVHGTVYAITLAEFIALWQAIGKPPIRRTTEMAA